jgi:pimeloyl-ACP methyl ester carboxylesterase
MPLHGPRREGRRGGDGFLSGDFVDTLHAQTQAVWDTRRLIGWLRAQGTPSIACYGISLGGYTAALLASLEKRLDGIIVGIPASDFVSLLEGHMPAMVARLAARIGFPFDSLRLLLAVASPLVLKPVVPRERRFIYAATHDGLAIPTQARDLWTHWEQPRIEWYTGSHVSFLWEPKVKSLVIDGLSAAGVLDA